MAMAMQQLEIDIPLRSSKGARNAMVNFQLISLFEVEVTPITSPALLLEQVRHFWRRLGMAALPFCPVDPVSIKWAFPALYLHMSLDWRHAMEVQRPLSCCKAPPSLLRMPVRSGSPRS